MEQKKYFDILQIYRGIASLLVVLHHTYASFAHFNNLDIPVLAFMAKVGKLGVDFFFVLSGFIIAYTTYQYTENKNYFKKYIFNRIIRVYIPYLPISLGILSLYFLMPNFSATDRSVSVLTSLTLFPHGNPALSVAWTLVFEMFFYIIFAINFFSKKIWYYFLGAWCFCIVYTAIFSLQFNNMIFKTLFSMYNLHFVLGVLAAYIVKSNFRIKYRYLLVAAWSILLCFLYLKYLEINVFPFFQNIVFVIAASIFVIIGVQHWNKKINANNIFMLIGNSSYSLYLLHNPLQSFLVRMFPKSNMQYLILGELILVILSITLISYVYYLFLEKRAIAYVKHKLEPYVS